MSLLKGKGSLYLLAPLNLLIWGYMAYKFYMSLGEPAPEDSLLPTAPPPVSQARDSQQYVLSLNYKDPFLKQEPVFHSKITAEKKPSASAKKQTAEVPRPAPIDIRYLGLVKNTSSGTITAIILLNATPPRPNTSKT